MLVNNLLVLKIFLLSNALAEWVEMPQFSDENKVYRISTVKQDHIYKFAQKNMENQFFSTFKNVSYKDIKIEQPATTFDESKDYDFYEISNTKESTTVKHLNKESTLVTSTEKYDETTVPLMSKKEEDQRYFNESITFKDTKLLNYLPVDILKSVHHTLKSQPTTTEGKLQFLKAFENTLITEIESRLTKSIMTDRKKRGTEHYYDHSYDHEHAAGFPSIEGALMAISFLTFAVYLVRLVMLLFRNMNNSASTTTGATLLVGRRKRSTSKLDDEMATIFKGLHSFSSKL